jgi:hypothetical protein
MSKKSSKKDLKKTEKKVEEKSSKINLEELIIQNLSNPRMTIDYAGYQLIDLDISVIYYILYI